MCSTDEIHGDWRLLDRIVAGDQIALGELYDRHSRLLFGLLVRMLGDHSDAEEVLQDVFLQTWTRADTFDPALGSAVGWLIGIARNRAIDRLRTNASRRPSSDVVHAAVSVVTPESAAVLGERQEAVRRALAGLHGEQRELIQQAYFRGLTQTELATKLNLPLGTVKTRIRTGLTQLRHALERTFTEQ
jgi:RNA polymerase sigma-70 factor (ECF subfamily)